jgi:hypothetical protein
MSEMLKATPADPEGAGVERVKKVKKSFTLTADNARRLAIHSVVTRTPEGAIVDELIEQHLDDYVIEYVGATPAQAGDDAA